jgi:hypothetical protein
MTYYSNSNITPKAAVKVLPIIHLALLTGQILFGIAVYNIIPSKGFSFDGSSNPFVYVSLALTFGGFTAGNILFTQLIKKIVPESTLSKKIATYQAAFIIRAALLEAPSLFSIVAYMLSGNLFFLGVSGLIVLYFLSFRPTKDKIINDLNLDYSEKTELEG